MDLRFTDDQRAIADLAEAVFRDFCGDDQTRAFAASGAPYDAALWRALTDAGLTTVTLPDAAGGSGLGMVELMLILEAQGRFIGAAPLWRHVLATEALARFGARKGANDQDLATVALDTAISADRTSAGWVLQGQAAATPLARASRQVIVAAEAEGATRLFVVPLNAPGLDLIDGVLTNGEPASDLVFNDVPLSAEALLDPAAADWLAPRAVACLAALQLGVAQEAMRRAAAYVGERKQFGRVIGSFQSVALRLAAAYIDVEALRSVLWRLCWALDNGQATAGDAEVTKIWAANCGHRVSHAAQHLHGGIGADISYPLHRFYLWSRALEMTGGGALRHTAALGDWLAAHPDPAKVFNLD